MAQKLVGKDRALRHIATILAKLKDYEWQAYPTSSQAKRQSNFAHLAGVIIEIVENDMIDFRWPPSQEKDG
jgi:hypothetical protein